MAACNLSIELDDSSKVYSNGEEISGQVIVRADKDVNCKGLLVSTEWATHGRGNVDGARAESQEVFSGAWQSGQEYRYPFKLKTAAWPPTYYGTYLNVSHQVHARARISWAFDPKASVEFPVAATESPSEIKQENSGCGLGIIGWIIGGVLLLVVGAMFLFLVPFLLIIGGVIWFFTSYLPKSVTGKVTCNVDPSRIKPGQTIRGSIEFHPKRKSRINGVTSTLKCEEVCVSGSGSNRTTHRHEVCSSLFTLKEADELRPGDAQRFDFEYQLPHDAPPSLDLSDNDIKWSVEMRIDIPRWPDYAKKIDLIVDPSENIEQLAAEVQQHRLPEQDWWSEVTQQLHASAGDQERLAMVLGAIREHVFELSLDIYQQVPRPIEAEEIAGGQWYESFDNATEETVLLYVGGDLVAPLPQTTWKGRASIVGFRAETGELIAMAVR